MRELSGSKASPRQGGATRSAAPEPGAPVRELKFSVSEGDAARLAAALSPLLPPDPHARDAPGEIYRVESLYFDTAALDVFHRSEGFSETKYRVRRYAGTGALFLEEKRKTAGLVRKRRTSVGEADVASLADRADTPLSGDAGDWFRERLRGLSLSVVCEIAYERWARHGEIEGVPVRVTVDRAIRCLPSRVARFAGAATDSSALALETRVLEMKFPAALPAALKEIVRFFSLRPSAVSKYRLAIERCGLAGGGPRP